MSLVLQSLLPYPNSCQGTSPHQQGWDTKMEKLSYGGIDLSKDRLDVVVLPEGWFFSVSTDTAGWTELVARLRPLAVCAIGLEPSGGYERGIIRALLAARLSVRRINPNKLRQFARARGVLAKNDRLDARLMAEYVAIMPTRAVQRDDAVDRLAQVVTMRRQLCDEHVTVENQTARLEDAMLRRLSKRRLVRLEADIRLLDKRLAEMVATNAAFAQLYQLLTSMPGVGPVLAFTLIALLPELGKMGRKQIAARPRSSDRCSGSDYSSTAAKNFRAAGSARIIFIARRSCSIDCS